MNHPYFEIYRDKGGKYRFRVKDADGKIVLTSPIKDSWDTSAEVETHVQGLRGLLGDAQIREEAS